MIYFCLFSARSGAATTKAATGYIPIGYSSNQIICSKDGSDINEGRKHKKFSSVSAAVHARAYVCMYPARPLIKMERAQNRIS